MWPFSRPPLRSQQKALEVTNLRSGYMWWMEVGLGKTGAALAEFEILRRKGYVDQLCVFTLNSFKSGWQDEAEKFGMPHKGVGIWPVKSFDGLWALIMNYEALTGRGHDAVVEWLQRGRTYFVADESQNIKNHQAARSKAMIQLGKEAPFTRPMTGTWGETVMDMWPQLRFAKALDGVNPFVFRNRYARMGGYMGKKVVGIRDDAREAYGALLREHVFEATQAEYLPDLPPALPPRVLRMDMPKVLQGHYREMRQDFVTMLKDGSEVAAELVITQMAKLQQITTGFIMDGERVEWLVPPTKSPKIAAIQDILDSIGSRRKLLVFTYHRPAIDGVCQALSEWGVPHSVIRGGMSTDELRESKAAFNRDGGSRVMVGQFTAAGAAHTLLGGEDEVCATTYFCENMYSLIKRTQAEGRNRRQGQKLPVEYIDAAMSSTELDMIKALQDKTSLVEAVRSALRG